MLKHSEVEIRVSELHTQRVVVPTWEVPILIAIHGDGVKVIGEHLIDRRAPETEDEFRRLSTRYRNTKTDDGSVGVPYVASVYGQFGIGTDKLARAIAAATVESVDVSDLLGEPETISSVGG
jgi:hypothetical protein